ncbi:MAG TPA: amidohydrolase family protein [Thermoanaerobaculia bacterium]|nr:amidohydrolase family protein [Thermoanaerobaculia bacterium]
MAHKRPLLLLFAFLAACTHQPAQAPQPSATPAATPAAEQTLRYTVLMSTNTAGSQVVTTRGDEITVDFEFNDRGRGPKTHTVLRVDGRGVPVSMHTTGNDYYKQQIEERFSIDGPKAKWVNTAETSEGPAGGFYSSMYGPPEEGAVLARALLKNGGRMAALPGGQASIRKVDETTIRRTHITAYEIAGLGFTPFEIWLDDSLNLFGSVSSWSSTIREGFEADAKPLIDAQDARSRTRIEEIAKRLTHQPTMGRLSIMNARIFDPRTGTLSAPTSIHVEGNRIAAIGGVQERSAADVWDAGGRIVLPGLWDMHTHLSDVDGLLNIAAGITSARDLGNDSDFITAFKEKIDSGAAIGPRIVLAGLVDGPGPFKGPTNILAENEEEARKAVDFFAGRKYEGLKIYSSIKPELVPVLTRYAHERGLRVSGHIPAGMRAEQAVDAGYDEIQHANMIFLNFMPDVTDTRTPARFTEVGKRGADLDLQSPDVRAFIAKLRDKRIVVDPTLTVFENLFTARAGQISPSYATVAHRFPAEVRRFFLTGGLPVPEGMDEKYRASYRRMIDLVGELHRSGVRIVAGTDALAGFALHRELELYADAGIPNADVLRIATLYPAEILKRDKDLGSVEAGKLADFIVVDGDPLANISDIRKVVRVVKDGKVFEPSELYREVGVQ